MKTKKDAGWGRLYRVTAKGLARVNLNCYESRILQVIFYKTICFNKESDIIPVTQIENISGINRRNHKRPINGLLKKGVIWRKGNEYGICKRFLDYENVSNQIHDDEDVSNQSKRVIYPEPKRIYPDNLIRPSHNLYHKKVLSLQEREKKREEIKKGLKMMKEAIGKKSDKKEKLKKLCRREA